MKKACLFLLFFISTNFDAFSQYLRINTINCTISSNEQSKIQKLLAYERMFFNELFDTDETTFAPVVLNIYGKLKDFRALKSTYQVFKQSDGFYIPNNNEAFLYKGRDFLTVCLHESSHSLFSSNFKNAPRWINEGIAEFFETFDFNENGELYASPQEDRIKAIKSGIASDNGNRLKTYFEMNSNAFYKESVDDNYNTAYSIIYFFIKSRNAEALKSIIKLTKEGKNSEEAIAQVFGNFEIFESRYKMFYYANK